MWAALVPVRDWLYLAVILALIGFGVYERNHLIDEGQRHEVTALKESSAKLIAQAQKDIAARDADYAAKVQALEKRYAQEHQNDDAQRASDAERLREYDAYRRAHPTVGSAACGPCSRPSGSVSVDPDGERFDRLASLAVELAAADSAARTALTACMSERDSLTHP